MTTKEEHRKQTNMQLRMMFVSVVKNIGHIMI